MTRYANTGFIEYINMKLLNSTIAKFLFILPCFIFASHAMANIVITGTRVIYPSDEKEISVKIANKGTGPVLIQAWMDNGDVNASPDSIHVPFVITPPMNRIDSQKGQTLRVSAIGNGNGSSDRETLYWFNVLEIPPANLKGGDVNKLQVAFRTRIKFFYRPVTLKGDSTTAAENIKWKVNNGQLIAVNDSPYYVTLLDVHSQTGNASASTNMIAPFGQASVKEKSGNFSSGQKITYEYINDWGAIKKVNTAI